MTDDDRRPTPESLLLESQQAARGKLKIYFGACAGVGKTWAMLQEAHRLQAQGIDVLVGIAESHGRVATQALLQGLTVLPRQKARGQLYDEFDLDGALRHQPSIILIDELAHSNAAGSRHPKRWQDIDELLDSGIDVLTTLNVQHLESLNDVVSGITGIQVRETIPDPFFEQANEVVLVDISPDDLLERLQQGNVYVGDRAERAIENFFRKGNLFALRELALRRTAERVDGQVRAWRDSRRLDDRVWHTNDALLVCIDGRIGSEKLIRVAARLASRLGCEWHVISVDVVGYRSRSRLQRHRVLQYLRIAENLGALTSALSADDRVTAIVRYAREHNLGKLIVGRQTGGGAITQAWRQRLTRQLGAAAPDLDVLIIACDHVKDTSSSSSFSQGLGPRPWLGYLAATLACAAITTLFNIFIPQFSPINVVMVYLLAVVLIALKFGRLPSVFASLINIVVFDWFFVNPKGELAISDAQYAVTFSIMLGVGLLIGNLTAGLRYQARVARSREKRSTQLYELARELNQHGEAQEIALAGQKAIGRALSTTCEIWLPNQDNQLQPLAGTLSELSPDRAILRWCFEKGQAAGAGTDTLAGVPYRMLPLQSNNQVYGVVVLATVSPQFLVSPEQQRLLETLVLLIAGAQQRVMLTQREQFSRVAIEREALRNSLLSALSHDLRTPLTVLFAHTEMLTLELGEQPSDIMEQLAALREQTLSMIRLVSNMLDMARIEAEGFRLTADWLSIEEVLQSACEAIERLFPEVEIRYLSPEHVILVRGEGPLLERVFVNLFENAIKYGCGRTAPITVGIYPDAHHVQVTICDQGPGLPPGDPVRLFSKFSRGESESAIPGVGMGLAICKAITELHDGHISAQNGAEGGACFTLTLPAQYPQVD
ncbi:two-component system sensor histidine kinase KdpD [Rosenbergiella collisarenosi]|uniref:two-component system sensor histidine kinase KdpD n=2 Tax=Rosenbergiella TaxID=1356488 RepID=UPI001F4FAA0E|nr:two-component system sensor histidine kinase KdpD [Rosenbergiella collisarenosi]